LRCSDLGKVKQGRGGGGGRKRGRILGNNGEAKVGLLAAELHRLAEETEVRPSVGGDERLSRHYCSESVKSLRLDCSLQRSLNIFGTVEERKLYKCTF
jgi:hypothetical protein